MHILCNPPVGTISSSTVFNARVKRISRGTFFAYFASKFFHRNEDRNGEFLASARRRKFIEKEN